MNMIWHVYGPRDSGPGERQQMLGRAQAIFDQFEVQNADIVRVDVPGRGASADSADRDGVVRGEVDPALPALQSGSLFGGRQGLLIVDGQQLLKGGRCHR